MWPSQEHDTRRRDPNSGVTYPMTVLVKYTNGDKEVKRFTNEDELRSYAAKSNVESALPLTRTGIASSPHLRTQ
jgi:hypothetical protein